MITIEKLHSAILKNLSEFLEEQGNSPSFADAACQRVTDIFEQELQGEDPKI